MCDTIVKKIVPKSEIPQYVYKRVQKVGENKYISPVMGESIPFNKWKKAPNIESKLRDRSVALCLIYRIKRKHKLFRSASSSKFEKHHNCRWGVFSSVDDAIDADLTSNFAVDKFGMEQYPTVVVKCELKGKVSSANFNYIDTYLVSHIKIIEEVCLARI